ncbi:hypothetical protein CRG98_003923 [Punica granatum]|uniref:Gag1-like clamp domain-containing protein n=1 Tax=Punica granatum TaxID=22663 RepID=A0A2I0L4V1_PUNGR|nr:hypothetical protein CRG98_003923 [Punica granatum]
MGSTACEEIKLSSEEIGVCTLSKDNSRAQSIISISSPALGSLDQEIDRRDSVGGLNGQTEFVNQGLLLWNQIRQQWVGSKKTERQSGLREPRISWNATYESLLGTNKPFRKPIPLFVSSC